jgi:hypothetical protein
MPATFNYASILHAVGQVLDQIGVKSFAIREEEDGLLVEGFDGEGQLQIQLCYDVASLYDLVTNVEKRVAEVYQDADSGVLQRFLATHQRELIGATR